MQKCTTYSKSKGDLVEKRGLVSLKCSLGSNYCDVTPKRGG